MRAPVGSSACWLCGVLDVLATLTMTATAVTSHHPAQGDGNSKLWAKLASSSGGWLQGDSHHSLSNNNNYWRRGEGVGGPETRTRRYPRAVQQQQQHHQQPQQQQQQQQYHQQQQHHLPAPPPPQHQKQQSSANQRPYALDHDLPPGNRKKDMQATDILQALSSRPENCSKNRIITLEGYVFEFKGDHFLEPFQEQVKKAVQLTNVLNSLFLYSRRSADLYKNVTYFALTHSLVQSDLKVKGCGIAFQLGQYRPMPPNNRDFFYPYSYRVANGATIVSDLTNLYEPFKVPWFFNQSVRDPSKFSKPVETVFTNSSDVGSFSRYVSRWNKTVHVSEKDGYWAKPYYDCLLDAWILQFSLPFFETLTNGTAIFKGVVLMDIDLYTMDINQCESNSNPNALFAGTHRCREESTQCVHVPGKGFQWGSYECECKPEFFFPETNATNRSFHGIDVELAYLEMINNRSLNYTQGFMCLPCRKGCETCEADEPCIVEFDVLLRGIPLGIQSFCMTIALVVGLVIARLRKTKVMRSSVWVLLEMIVLGALLLYATVVIQYFEPTATNCLLVPWFREVGFAILYGTLVLKIYRILAEFQSRKAHRVHVRDKDLFKSLAVILVVVLGYMSAWTAVSMDHLDTGAKLIDIAVTEEGLNYVLCKSLSWDYAIEIAEVLFLGVGVYLSYCVRAAPADYSEGRYVTVAICYELVFSSIFYVLKHLYWLMIHPDYLFLMYFIRCQMTVTINLLILLGPKLWYAHRPPDDDRMRTRAYSQSDVQDSTAPETMKLNVGISSNGDVDVGEISLTEMDPEDIRAELKRLYTQLQIYRTKTMRKDNPHISKRRGGRKQTHRRFSLQAFHHKHRHHHEHEHEHEMSKTPEESTNSAEAMTFTMEPSVKEEPNEGGSTGGSGGSGGGGGGGGVGGGGGGGGGGIGGGGGVGGGQSGGGGVGGGGRNTPSVSFKPGHT